LIYSRDRLREIFIFNKDTTDIEYYCPIKVERLINKIRASVKSRQKQEPTSPLFIYEKV